jgi:hypothetical protein
MAATSDHRPLQFLLTDSEVEEFRQLAREHAGAELTADEARSVSAQLLRVLAIIRDVAQRSSNDSASSVHAGVLPRSLIRGITTVPPV